MTNLLIGHNTAIYEGTIEASTTAATGYEARKACGGDRSRGFKTSASVTTSQIDFDLGSGVTMLPDYYLFSRLDLVRGKDSASMEVRLQGDDNSAFSSPETDEHLSVDLTDLTGPNSRDWIDAGVSFSSAYRYIRLELVTTQSFQHEWPLVSFGTWLDMGRDPSYPAQIRRSVLSAQNRARRPQWSFSFTWDGITDTKRNEFLSMYKYRNLGPVWLYDQNDYILQGDELVCAYIEDVLITPEATNSNQIKVSFREVL